MALFQKRPQVSNPLSYTTFSLNKILVIVGLGNPGEDYELTRHNVGFMCIDDFARRNNFDPWIAKKDLKCLMASQTLGDTRVILIKPQTFMNLSGEAVQAVLHFYKLQADQVAVVYDDLDVDFGQVRIRTGGSSAGHNGIKSISQLVDENYTKIRVGIGPKVPAQIDTADFVLQTFSTAEQEHLPALQREVTAVLSEYAYGSVLSPETRSFL